MIHLDLHLLTKNLGQTPESKPISTEGINTHLLEYVIQPAFRGEVIRFGDLDYDQFDDVDIREAANHCDLLERLSGHLNTLCSRMSELSARPSTRKQFC